MPAEDEAVSTSGTIQPESTEALDTAIAEALGAPADDAGAPADEAPVPAPAMTSTPEAVLVEAVSGGLSWVPFAVYLGAWIVLVGVSAYLLYGASAEEPARWLPAYGPLLWTGVGLAAAGPLLSVGVWLVARRRRTADARRGLFASAFTRGALVAFFGMALWVTTLFVLELVASGGAL